MMIEMNGRLGVVGCGNMGGAMLRKALSSGILRPEQVIVSDKNEKLLAGLKADLCVETTTNNSLPAQADVVMLCVKPQYIRAAIEEMMGFINPNALIISIVTGYDLNALRTLIKNDHAHLVRVMPNTPALVGEGVLAACRGNLVTNEEWAFTMKFLSCMGMAEEVPETLMDAVTGVSGSSPAFVFLFMEALADAGVRGGLPRAMAQRFAAQVLLGSAKLALETGLHPGQLKDMVTSPAGTTIEGVAALEENRFRFSVMDAVDAAIQKAKSFHEK